MRALCIVVVVALAGPAAAGGIGVLPIATTADIGPDAAARSAQVEGALNTVLGRDNYEKLPACNGATDLTRECAQSAAQKSKGGVDEVALFVVRKIDAGTYAVKLVVRDGAQGAEVFRDEVTASDDRATRGLVARAFAPAQYGGKLRVQSLPVGSVVLVDGLPITDDVAFLRAGPHLVEVIEADGFGHTMDVDVKYGTTTAVRVPPRVAQQAPRSDVPLYAAAGVATAGLAMFATGVLLQTLVYDVSARNALVELREDNERTRPTNDQDPTGSDWSPSTYGGDANKPNGLLLAAMAVRQRQRSESLVASRGFFGVAVGGGAIAAVAGGTALLLLVSGELE